MPEKISRYDNVNVEFDGSVMVIKIETDEDKVVTAPSKSGKTQVIATTGGAMALEELKLNLTLYRPR